MLGSEGRLSFCMACNWGEPYLHWHKPHVAALYSVIVHFHVYTPVFWPGCDMQVVQCTSLHLLYHLRLFRKCHMPACNCQVASIYLVLIFHHPFGISMAAVSVYTPVPDAVVSSQYIFLSGLPCPMQAARMPCHGS